MSGEWIADYQIMRQVGQGNHGTLFLARPPERLKTADEFVALKALGNNATDADFARIANELRLLNSIDNPHVVHLLDAGSHGTTLFMAMKYYQHGSLAHQLGSSTLTPDAIGRIVADAARGAHALHEAGVAHRDIKPANVLIDQDRGVLGDLGLAEHASGRTTTVGGGPIGSIEFIAPELIRGNKASRRTDVWSLGLTYHWALSGGIGAYGTIPTTAMLSAFRHVLRHRPEIHLSVPSEARAIIERCVSEDASQRYLTALELSHAIHATVGTGGSASPPPAISNSASEGPGQ